jgi:hypothetical protein
MRSAWVHAVLSKVIFSFSKNLFHRVRRSSTFLNFPSGSSLQDFPSNQAKRAKSEKAVAGTALLVSSQNFCKEERLFSITWSSVSLSENSL